MTISTGTSQTSVASGTNTSTDQIVYVTKFVSMPLTTTSIAANTWTLNFAFKIQNSTNQTCPVKEGATNPKYSNLPVTIYIWRPSTGAKVGNIYDQDTPGTTGEFHDCSKTGTSELVEHGTLACSAVTAAAGDVIVFEAWIYSTDTTTRALGNAWFYDGTVANTTNETIVSDHASFLETPQTLVFQGTNQNKTATVTETVTIGATTPTRLKGSKRTSTETITISSPAPARLAAKNKALPTQTVTISTDPGSPSIVKAKNTNVVLTETVAISSTPTFQRNKVRALTSTVTIGATIPTFIQHPNRLTRVLSETVSIASTVVRKNAKKRTLLN